MIVVAQQASDDDDPTRFASDYLALASEKLYTSSRRMKIDLIVGLLGWLLSSGTRPCSALLGGPVPSPGTRSIRLLKGPDEHDSYEEDDLSLEAFQDAKKSKELGTGAGVGTNDKGDEFDGYALRDVILGKWGRCYDVEFQRAFVFRGVYLNVLPFYLGRRPFRHPSEYDYLCHLQAVVDILVKYDQLDYVLYQIQETTKKPLAGRSPIVAVPLRLNLTKDQVNQVLGDA
jgi:hypothetical protein